MRGSLLMVLLAVGLALSLGLALQAADPQLQQQPGQEQATQAQGMKILRASDLIGVVVNGQNKERIGKIDNLAIDEDNGQVRYVIVSVGTTMGFGGKLLPVPWQAFKVTSGTTEQGMTEIHAMLNVNKDALAKAPGFQQGQWPDFSNPKWATVINDFYRPYMAKRAGGYTR